jgi:hypothetical protein
MRTRWMWGFLLGATVCSLLATRANYCQADVVKENLAPQVADKGQGKEVVLPAPLLEAVHAAFPEARVPKSSDCAGAWSKRAGKALPFVAWGDFTDDGLTDVAVILVGAETKWAIVMFNQARGGKYAPFVVADGSVVDPADPGCPQPTWLTLKTIKKGERGAMVRTDASGNQEVDYVPMDRDIVRMSVEDSSATQYRWNGSKYDELGLGGE